MSLTKGAELSKDVKPYFSDPVAGLKKLANVLDFQIKVRQCSFKASLRQPVEEQTDSKEDDKDLRTIHTALSTKASQLSQVLHTLRHKAASLSSTLSPLSTASDESSRSARSGIRAMSISATPEQSLYGLTPIHTTPMSLQNGSTDSSFYDNGTTRRRTTPSQAVTTTHWRTTPSLATGSRAIHTGPSSSSQQYYPQNVPAGPPTMLTEAHTIGQIRNPFI